MQAEFHHGLLGLNGARRSTIDPIGRNAGNARPEKCEAGRAGDERQSFEPPRIEARGQFHPGRWNDQSGADDDREHATPYEAQHHPAGTSKEHAIA
jgi:hypothetical protein